MLTSHRPRAVTPEDTRYEPVSQIDKEMVTCPSCGEMHEQVVFRSLNGERVPAQVQRLLDGTFEVITCALCGHWYQPEHRMLYSHFALRTWIVMMPLADRERFATLEHGVALTFERDFQGAPPPVAAGLRGVRPRLVFGQTALSEAVRVAEAGLEPALLECAKLLVFRRNLGTTAAYGPVELIYEGLTNNGAIQLGVIELGSGARRDTVISPHEVLDEVAATRAEFEARYPSLFVRPYVSATRYLFGANG